MNMNLGYNYGGDGAEDATDDPKVVKNLMFRFVWYGENELRLEWDEDCYIRTNAVKITDEDPEVEEACRIMLAEYFRMMGGN